MVKIALLSDIHFGKDSRSKDFAIPGQEISDSITGGVSLYDGLVTLISNYKPEFILCTGDLTSTGKPLEFQYCLQKIYELADISSVSKSNVIYCFGNHDIDWSLVEHVKTKYENLGRAFTDDEVDFLSNYYSGISHSWLQNTTYIKDIDPYCSCYTAIGPIPMSGIVERDNIVFFILNSGYRCSSVQTINHGQLTSAQLEWLEDELRKQVCNQKWKVVILHHHPLGYEFPIICPEFTTLEEGPRLQTLCGRYGVNIIMHGHRHHPWAETNKKDTWDNYVTFISAGSLSVNQEGRLNGAIPNTFHLIELDEYPFMIKLITYEFTIGDGWRAVTSSRKELPLDHQIYLGRETINDVEAMSIIKALPKNINISYDQIDSSLKYIRPSHLNALLKTAYGLALSGDFPGFIQIHES